MHFEAKYEKGKLQIQCRKLWILIRRSGNFLQRCEHSMKNLRNLKNMVPFFRGRERRPKTEILLVLDFTLGLMCVSTSYYSSLNSKIIWLAVQKSYHQLCIKIQASYSSNLLSWKDKLVMIFHPKKSIF